MSVIIFINTLFSSGSGFPFSPPPVEACGCTPAAKRAKGCAKRERKAWRAVFARHTGRGFSKVSVRRRAVLARAVKVLESLPRPLARQAARAKLGRRQKGAAGDSEDGSRQHGYKTLYKIAADKKQRTARKTARQPITFNGTAGTCSAFSRTLLKCGALSGEEISACYPAWISVFMVSVFSRCQERRLFAARPEHAASSRRDFPIRLLSCRRPPFQVFVFLPAAFA